MTIKHRVLLFINKIKFKKVVRDKLPKKKPKFGDYLIGRKALIEKNLSSMTYFNDEQRKLKKVFEIRLLEVDNILEAYKNYGKK